MELLILCLLKKQLLKIFNLHFHQFQIIIKELNKLKSIYFLVIDIYFNDKYFKLFNKINLKI